MKKEKKPLVRCKHCKTRLRHNYHGQYCPTRNCPWNTGVPEDYEVKKDA